MKRLSITDETTLVRRGFRVYDPEPPLKRVVPGRFYRYMPPEGLGKEKYRGQIVQVVPEPWLMMFDDGETVCPIENGASGGDEGVFLRAYPAWLRRLTPAEQREARQLDETFWER